MAAAAYNNIPPHTHTDSVTTTPTTTATPQPAPHRWREHLLLAIHLIAILLSCLLVAYITYDTLRNVSFVADPRYLRVQFWICLFFIFDILVEVTLSPRHWRTLRHNLLFLVVCIPYLNLIHHFGIEVTPAGQYLLRLLPMARAAYVMAILAGLLSSSWITNMFRIYLVLLCVTVYFGSLMFYVAEHYVNPGVTSYWASLWWSIMDLTTCGCDIYPMTPTGKAIAILLSAEGLILFPVFTVYFTQALTSSRASHS